MPVFKFRVAPICLALACSFVAALVLTPALFAAPVTYFGEDAGQGEGVRLATHPNSDAARAALLANLVGVGTENLESYAPGTGAPLAVTFPGAGTATLQGNGLVVSVPTGTNGFGRYPISGDNYWESTDVFSIVFSQPIAAFGFYGIDVGDFSGRVTLTLIDGGQTQLVIPHSVGGLGGAVIYFGFYDTANQYTSITFGNTAPGVDFFAFDDFTIGSIEQVVPTGACCLSTGCAPLTGNECAARGGVYLGDGSRCTPLICSVPAAVATWGEIKGTYR